VEATRTIAKLRAGQTARFFVERDDVLLDAVTVQIGNRPLEEDRLKLATGDNSQSSNASTTIAPPAPSAGSMYNTGLSLVDLSATFRDSIGMRPNQVGVYVDTVAPGSNAAMKGIKSGMVILEANSKVVASVSQFRQLVLSAKKAGQRSLVLLVRTINGSETYTSISLN
jgi:serine protease Do